MVRISGALLLLLSPLACCGATRLDNRSSTVSAARSVSYDSRSLLLGGARIMVSSGSIHYQRHDPSDWPRVLALAAEAGFNHIQTYVQWDLQEPENGTVVFSGRNNVSAFAAAAAAAGLLLTVRIGPYTCGEHFNGGVPLWLRAVEGSGAACFRCSDAVWEAFTARALAALVGELQRAGALYPDGGNVIALQVENEYSGSDAAYLEYCVATARATTTAVPWILCHDLDACSAVNAALGIPSAALCSVNGFWLDGSEEGVQQPSPAFMLGQRAKNPTQPTAWTEDQGWFDQWGVGHRIRHTSDILYGWTRALSYGLSYHNFYMLTGGSNFGLTAADGVTTAYAPDTAIDWLLLRHEPKFSTMKAFNAALASVSAELLAHAPPAAPTPLGAHCELSAYGSVVFVSNLGTNASASETVSVAGQRLLVPNHTVIILRAGAVVFNTSAAPDLPLRPPPPPARAARAEAWSTLVEHLGAGNASAQPAAGAPPLEMLALTRNAVDYAYYVLAAPPLPANASELSVGTCGGEYVYVFLDGAALPRASLSATRDAHTFALPLRARAPAAIAILVSAMGLSTSPTPESCKGVRRVTAGATVLTTLGWETRWLFAGEVARVYTPAGAAAAPWQPVEASGGAIPTSWFKTTFDLPTPPARDAAESDVPPGAPPQLAYALDLAGATKGIAWVNGFNIGRYNLELGICNGPCAPPLHGGECFLFWSHCGEPTQRYYHVPTALLKPTGNLVVLFEETATVPVAGQGPVAPSPPPRPAAASVPVAAAPGTPRDLSHVALVALTEHPL